MEEEVVLKRADDSFEVEAGYMEFLIALSLHRPVVDKDTFDITFDLFCYDCELEHDSPSSFQDFHKSLVVPTNNSNNIMLIFNVTEPEADRLPPLVRALQTGNLCHYPIFQDMNIGIDTAHVLLHFSPKTAFVEYTAFWQSTVSAQNMCHRQLDQSVESTLMVRFEKFRCSMMWWIHGMYAIEAAEWRTPESQ